MLLLQINICSRCRSQTRGIPRWSCDRYVDRGFPPFVSVCLLQTKPLLLLRQELMPLSRRFLRCSVFHGGGPRRTTLRIELWNAHTHIAIQKSAWSIALSADRENTTEVPGDRLVAIVQCHGHGMDAKEVVILSSLGQVNPLQGSLALAPDSPGNVLPGESVLRTVEIWSFSQHATNHRKQCCRLGMTSLCHHECTQCSLNFSLCAFSVIRLLCISTGEHWQTWRWKYRYLSWSKSSGCSVLTREMASSTRPFCTASRILIRSSRPSNSMLGWTPLSTRNFSAASLNPSEVSTYESVESPCFFHKVWFAVKFYFFDWTHSFRTCYEVIHNQSVHVSPCHPHVMQPFHPLFFRKIFLFFWKAHRPQRNLKITQWTRHLYYLTKFIQRKWQQKAVSLLKLGNL